MAEEAGTSLFPFDLPDRTAMGIRGVSFRAAAAIALGFRTREEAITPEKAAGDVSAIIRGIVARNNFGMLPVEFNDEESLNLLSGGRIKPGTHYPQQTGLLVARAGFETFVAVADTMPAPAAENLVIVSCAAASAHWYLQLGNTEEKETDRASGYVAHQVSEAWRTANPGGFIEEAIAKIRAGAIDLSDDKKNPPSDLFIGSIKMALQITKLTMDEMAAPPVPLPPDTHGGFHHHHRFRLTHRRHNGYH